MLRASSADHHDKKGFFGWFNRLFDSGNDRYQRGVEGMLKHRGRYMIIFLLIVGGLALLFKRILNSFLPEKDQSLLFIEVTTTVNFIAEGTATALDDANTDLPK